VQNPAQIRLPLPRRRSQLRRSRKLDRSTRESPIQSVAAEWESSADILTPSHAFAAQLCKCSAHPFPVGPQKTTNPGPESFSRIWSPLIRSAQWLLGLLTAKTGRNSGLARHKGSSRPPLDRRGVDWWSGLRCSPMKTPGCRADPDQQSNGRQRTKLCVKHFIEALIRFRFLFLRPSGSFQVVRLTGQFPSRAPCIDAQVLCSAPRRNGNDKRLFDGTFSIGFDLLKQR
jgi:hypothetical protein